MRDRISVWLTVSRSFLFLFICFYSNRTNEVLNKNILNTLVATSRRWVTKGEEISSVGIACGWMPGAYLYITKDLPNNPRDVRSP